MSKEASRQAWVLSNPSFGLLSRTPRLELTLAPAHLPMPKARPTATRPTCAQTWRRRSVPTSRPCPLPWHLTVTTMLAPVLRQTRALMGHHVGLQLWPLLSNVSCCLSRPPVSRGREYCHYSSRNPLNWGALEYPLEMG